MRMTGDLKFWGSGGCGDLTLILILQAEY
jgi:hypothetical protein